MTTSTTTPRLSYTADGSTAAFTFNFEIADSSSIAVYVGSTLKALTSEYTVSFDSGTSGTGTVTFTSAPSSGTVTLIRDTNLARTTDFENSGAFLASTVNTEFDRLSQAVIDATDKIEQRAILLAEPNTETPTLTLPDAATRANKSLIFDANGDISATAIANGTVTSTGITSSNLTVSGSPITTSGNITVNLPASITADVTGDLTGNVTGNVTGDLTGNVTGNVTGDLTGNVTGDLTGAVTGNVTGDVTGDLTGDVTGNVTGNVTGDVTGDVTGNLTGDVTGNITANSGNSLLSNLQVTGNLTVDGTQTVVNSTNLSLEDSFIELNRNNSSTATDADAGLFIRNGNSGSGPDNVAFYWDHGQQKFLTIRTDVDPNTSPADLYDGVTTYWTGILTGSIEAAGSVKGGAGSEFYDVTFKTPSGGASVLEISNNNITGLRSNEDIVITPAGTGQVSANAILNVNSNRIVNVASPISGTDAANQNYVDTAIADINAISQLDTSVSATDTGTGSITATVDGNTIFTATDASGLTMSKPIAMGTNKITGLGTPTAGTDAVTKSYVDDNVSAVTLTTIGEGNSSITVADSGTGSATVTVDGTNKIVADATDVTINGLTYPTADGTANQVLTTDGAGNLTFASSSAATLTGGAIEIVDNDITGTRSNEDINITPAGTGKVVMDDVKIHGSTIEGPEYDPINYPGYKSTIVFDSDDILLEPALAGNIVIGNTNSGSPVDEEITTSGNSLVIRSGASGGAILTLHRNQFDYGNIELYTGSESGATNPGVLKIGGNYQSKTIPFNDSHNLEFATVANNTNIVLNPHGTGVVDVSTSRITNVTDPTSAQDAATKAYVDANIAGGQVGDLSITGSTISAPSNANLTLAVSGTGEIDVDSNKIINLAEPTADSNAATKKYVDDSFAVISSTSISQLDTNVTVTDSGTGTITGTVDNTAIFTATVANGLNASKITTDGITVTDNEITASRSNDNLNITAAGTGKVTISGIAYPTADGTSNQVLTTDGSGNLSFTTVSGTDQNLFATVAGDTGSTTADSITDTLTVAGGTGISTAVSGDTLTITATGGANTGDIVFDGNTMSTGSSNADFEIESSGTGKILLQPNGVDLNAGQLEPWTTSDYRVAGATHIHDVITGITPGSRQYKYDTTFFKTDGTDSASGSARFRKLNQVTLDLNGSELTDTGTSRGAQIHDAIYSLNSDTVNDSVLGTHGGSQVYSVVGNDGTSNFDGSIAVTNSFGMRISTGVATNNASTTHSVTNQYGIQVSQFQYGPGTQTTTNYTAFDYAGGAQNTTNAPYLLKTSDDRMKTRPGALEKFNEWSYNATHSSGGTYTIDWANGNLQTVTLTSNITGFTMTNFPTDTKQSVGITLYLIQDGTGSRTISFTAGSGETFKFANGNKTANTGGNDITVVHIFNVYDGSSNTFYWTVGPAYTT